LSIRPPAVRRRGEERRTDVKYVLLIYGDPTTPTPPEEYAEYGALAEDLGKAGKMLGGEELTDAETGTLVRVRDGERLVTDGPYSETKEHLGGFFLIEAADLDEAIGYAARIPAAKYGGVVEVRACVAEQH
jgi:hypothetical protein